MTKDRNVLNDEPPRGLSTDQIIHWGEIRQALLRLRQLGEKLPPADAVATIREGRDLAPKSN
jgi:hypothetical protein